MVALASFRPMTVTSAPSRRIFSTALSSAPTAEMSQKWAWLTSMTMRAGTIVEIEPGEEALGRREEDLAANRIGAFLPVHRHAAFDRDEARHLAGEEDAGQQHADEHALGEIVRGDHRDDGRQHHHR